MKLAEKETKVHSPANLRLAAEAIIRRRDGQEPATPVILETRDLTIKYGDFKAIRNVDLKIHQNRVTALIGPSGCGKSTLLRHFNRMNEFIDGVGTEGEVLYHGTDLYHPNVDPVQVRRMIGMVFQKPNPFPKSIYENIAMGPRTNQIVPRNEIPDLVEEALRGANLWDEVKDRLNDSGYSLSGGQQQRLCIARAIAMKPDVILMDEPCSALDPISTEAIENLIFELRNNFTIVIVTHNMQQAARVSDFTALLITGDLIEFGETQQIFLHPVREETEQYITGRFG